MFLFSSKFFMKGLRDAIPAAIKKKGNQRHLLKNPKFFRRYAWNSLDQSDGFHGVIFGEVQGDIFS